MNWICRLLGHRWGPWQGDPRPDGDMRRRCLRCSREDGWWVVVEQLREAMGQMTGVTPAMRG